MRFYTVNHSSNFYNTQAVNHSLQQKGGKTNPAKAGKTQREDKVMFSPSGKSALLLENLQKQKKGIIQQKESLISSVLEKGGSIEDIQEQLDELTLRVDDIDKKMLSALAEQTRAFTENITKQKEEPKRKKVETQEEADKEQINDLFSLSSSLDQSKAVSSVNNKIQGEAAILEGQADFESGGLEMHMQKRAQSGDTIGGPERIAYALQSSAISEKYARVAELYEKAAQGDLLSSEILEKANLKNVQNQQDRLETPLEKTDPETQADAEAVQADVPAPQQEETAH